MNVAVISDIHANRHALEAVLDDIDDAGVDQIWFLGDAVGYGAFPEECVMKLKERCSVFLLGNHDLAALREIDIGTFSPSAAISARWTREKMSDEGFEILRNLEGTSAEREGIGMFHASPRDPVWEYVVDSDMAEDNLDFQKERIALIGHSHIALYFTRIDEMSRVSSMSSPKDALFTVRPKVNAMSPATGRPPNLYRVSWFSRVESWALATEHAPSRTTDSIVFFIGFGLVLLYATPTKGRIGGAQTYKHSRALSTNNC